MPTQLRRNLDDVRARIERARARSGRAAARVDLVVVTKGVPDRFLPLLAEAGVADVGENRVASAARRRPGAPPALRWHGIGHLQRNKAASALEVFDVFHALDSLRLARHLARLAEGRARPWPVYLQVNAGNDPAKGGVPPEAALGTLAEVLRLPCLAVLGLMTMAAHTEEERQQRLAFRTLCDLRDAAATRGLGDPPPNGLSMGMTNDFEIAVEEGATVVRVGRAIFDRVVGEPAPSSAMPPPPGAVRGGDRP